MAMSISSGGASPSSKVRKPPSREEPSGRYLTICQWPGASRAFTPVFAGYAVLAHEQRLAGEHAHAPVELRGQEFLRQQEIGLLEQLVGDAAELLRRVHLVHAARERAV